MNPLIIPILDEVIGAVGKAADDLITSDEERAKIKLDDYKAETERMSLQTEINKEEAKNASVFVAGWRPAVGWVCAFALFYSSLLEPLLRFAAQVWFGYAGTFPVIDTDLTLQVLFGILGLGAYRSFEKVKGVAR